MRKKIVITGASGGVIGRVLPALRETYDTVLLDVHETNSAGEIIEGINKIDLVNPDRDSYRRFFTGTDTVIHTAYMFSDRIEKNMRGGREFAHLQLAMNDIQMAYNVFKTSLEEGVKRVIFFSSNHAADYYEQLIRKGVMESVDEDAVPYSDGYYGWSKLCEEALGHIFASAIRERRLELIVLRVGAPRTDLIENVEADNYYTLRRHFASYLSVNDELQLLKLCVEKEDIKDKNGVPFLLLYATSDNHNRIWSLRNAVQVLGYKPEDSSYSDFSERAKDLFMKNIDIETQRRKKGGIL